ncbi:MarR family winged helix-turn-helix transcriptional regulator [Constantimarinum furrinae]|uniref:Transcriptional regulator n=1 Tax=Constantimarinum furrinae TaxID=2562285 RepID=A0A7G8PXQ5_9FLAO|nr:MarR family winged helix-turn-helix transcriptional regulator [Constantimarinum furrinae]QNJ99121.1 Transcriptional regulator [Constantimarinum furrinae]
MKKSAFNPEGQQAHLSGKIVAGMERISEAFKVLLWEKAKELGLSPIQIQLLIFTAFHKEALCNVSDLAREFNVTKPTVSDAIRVLHNKGFIIKDHSSADSRSYTIILSESGKEIVKMTENFADPMQQQIEAMSDSDLEHVFETLSKLIFQLNRTGILTVQRTCYGCKFYSRSKSSNYCNLLEKPLFTADIRLDCPEFESA